MTSILKADTIQDTDGNNIINENSNTITIGASGDTTNIIGTLQNNGSALSLNPITVVDQWRITADHSGVADITANWERVDTDGFNYIGTGMSESSGIFTFPSTGIWLIMFNASAYTSGGASGFMRGSIQTTLNGGGDGYSRAANGYVSAGAAGYYKNLQASFIFDVTNTSQLLVKFGLTQNNANTPIFVGDTGDS